MGAVNSAGQDQPCVPGDPAREPGGTGSFPRFRSPGQRLCRRHQADAAASALNFASRTTVQTCTLYSA